MTPDADHQLNALAAYFRSKLSGQRVTEAAIESSVDTDLFATSMDDTTRSRLKRLLKQTLFITQESGHLIKSDVRPWLAGRKAGIDQYYWQRLRDYLIGSGELPATVVSRLDTVTDSILDCCGDPLQPGTWSSRGMVMGHVQSGKTTNYGALICKAADAGYKVIILLAGITNSLRSQTQQRMDEYFIGRKSVFNAAAQAPLDILSYARPPRYPDFGTSRDQDFSRNNAVTGAALSSLKEPKIFVIKKNKSVIENLNTWLHDQAIGGRIDEPLLMIDDEADNASVNTHKDPGQSTAINLAIKETLAKFNRSTFIGYTATPFANIFIDPDSVDEFKREDLFPRNFIRSLEPPTNYCGAHRYFTEEGDLSKVSVRPLDDYKDFLPLNHKKTHPVEELPPSLQKAVRVFVLARTIRVLRGDGRKHCTMMVNASRFNDVQDKLEGSIYAYLSKLRKAIDVWSLSDDALSDPMIRSLEESFLEEYPDVKADDRVLSFRDILAELAPAASTIQVRTVNMLKKANALNYDANKKEGLHVIAIGGLALSRGLTLDGLVVTYLLRNVGASDTLMQMARWFGYRPNYEDICRIYLPESGKRHYEEVHLSIEELRGEIGRMELVGGTPLDFGLKVRQSETGIRITAANKMRTATQMVLAAGYAGRFIQGHALINRDEVNVHNRAIASEFLNKLGGIDPAQQAPYFWSDVEGRAVVKLLEDLEFPRQVQPLWKIDGKRSLLGDYISDRLDAELKKWDVCLATTKGRAAGSRQDTEFLPGQALYPASRGSGAVKDGNYQVSGTKNAVADQDTPALGLSRTDIEGAASVSVSPPQNRFCLVRKRPLLVLFLVNPQQNIPDMKIRGPVLSVALCMPPTEKDVREHIYQINLVLRDQIMQESADNADDDEVMLAGEA